VAIGKFYLQSTVSSKFSRFIKLGLANKYPKSFVKRGKI
jgi:hypothetical protein